ncbi:SGNH/GDSL hydrolase family protein [Runella salmonicolor]|uniref:SGNH/GDSL hydrolase family protein n=1 Tax=Runella salmonicolor TaxID=2950278 RepID=A0ABT1FQ96_9BACT|nr:SGNH/GDSL hydrolase family protein [Runella salmonicolor]MCP1383944.1 SGNH/GDSL hydrolase family protein [Runella salmonicolor]
MNSTFKKRHQQKTFWYIIFYFFSLSTTVASGPKPFPKKIHRIVFIGNSITYAGQFITDIEAYLLAHYPNRRFEFINVGLPSETVSGLSEPNHAGGRFPRPDLHERLERVLTQTKPDFVFACYGMNDGIYLPLDEERFRKFREGITWLHTQIADLGVPIVHLTPPIYDELKGKAVGYAAVLDTYSEWLLSQRKAQKWEVADLHFPMKTYLEQHRQNNPDFALAKDGVHPDALGHWLMAKQVLMYLGEKGLEAAEDVQTTLAIHPNGEEILKLVAERQQLMKDAWLTSTGHTRPEMKVGLPMEDARKKGEMIEKQLRELLKKK